MEFLNNENKREKLNFSDGSNENYLPEEIGEPKWIDSSEDNYPEDREPVDEKGRDKDQIFEDFKNNYGLSESNLITFDKKNQKWQISGKDPGQWKKEMSELYDDSNRTDKEKRNDQTYGHK